MLFYCLHQLSRKTRARNHTDWLVSFHLDQREPVLPGRSVLTNGKRSRLPPYFPSSSSKKSFHFPRLDSSRYFLIQVFFKNTERSYITRLRCSACQQTLRKTRRQRQRGLMSRTIAVHVHYNSWYISLPSSAKQQREITKFCVVWRT